MKIRITDYRNIEKEFDIGELKDIKVIMYYELSGDGILSVYYKNGNWDWFDSCDKWRMHSYFDCELLLYVDGFPKEYEELFTNCACKQIDDETIRIINTNSLEH